MDTTNNFVSWFRSVAPYINAFRGKTFVIAFSGKMTTDEKFVHFIHDINLLASLGIRLVLVHGARQQIQLRLDEQQLDSPSVRGMRVTNTAALQYIKESVGRVHIEIEALLSMSLPNSPMANAAIRVTSGNFVIARPAGVIDGVDLMHTGKVRKINAEAIHSHLQQGDIVLTSPLGYSLTGEIFNLTFEHVATEIAIALEAEKLIFLLDPLNTKDDVSENIHSLARELTVADCKILLNSQHKTQSEDITRYLNCAIKACETNVTRTHLINHHLDGAILQELFTHNGIGCMISQQPLQYLRSATINDVGSILQLIEPLEAEGILVRRNRELLEIEIDHFVILEHDSMIIGCAALYLYTDQNVCELACLAVHPDYQNTGYGNLLLKHLETKSIEQGIQSIFVLTTHATHWFIEHGFSETTLTKLPKEKQDLYNYQRRSKVYIKTL